ncbi:Histone-lysine N-methyltransferase NSD2 [Halotydeus destructor]|nr:Histone-lysine N-methyltransferase NSD2 [Halotydeus destructor]
MPQNNSSSTEVPEKATVVFPATSRILFTRKELLKIPEKSAVYGVGDLIWFKGNGFPFWPCMITIDPLEGVYTKNDHNNEPVYHVQYFGNEASRGWTRGASTVLPFEGLEKFDLVAKASAPSPAKGRGGKAKINPKYSVEQRHKKLWTIAVAQAEVALNNMDHQQRIDEFTFNYIIERPAPEKPMKDTNGKATPGKRKRPIKAKNTTEDIYDFDDEFGDGDYNASPSPLKLFSSLKKSGDYEVFASRERDALKRANPAFSTVKLDEMLKDRWELMSEDLKTKYAPRSQITHDPSLDTPKASSARKRQKKAI